MPQLCCSLFYYLPLIEDICTLTLTCCLCFQKRNASRSVSLSLFGSACSSAPCAWIYDFCCPSLSCCCWDALLSLNCCFTVCAAILTCLVWSAVYSGFQSSRFSQSLDSSSDQTSQLLLFASVYELCSRERMCLCTCAEILILNVWVWGKEVMWLVWCYPLLSPSTVRLSGCETFFHADSWSVVGHVWGHSVCNPDQIKHSRRSVQPGLFLGWLRQRRRFFSHV